MRRLCRVVLCLLSMSAASATRAETPVDLALVLAVDVSRSIDAEEFELQRAGYAMAFRDRRVADTINGLTILNDEPMLDIYYQQNVIGGPGAFVVATEDFDQFATAVLAKLIREIAAAPEY